MNAALVKDAEYCLPSPHLAGANWADAFVVVADKPDMTALEAARQMLERKLPGWIAALMTLRDRLGTLIGLKAAVVSTHRETVGFFPIIDAQDDCVVLGFDDWHLDFRIVVETRKVAAKT